MITAINNVKLWLSSNLKDLIYTIFPENTDSMILAAMMMDRGSPAAPQSRTTTSYQSRETPISAKSADIVSSIPSSMYQRDESDMNMTCVVCLGLLHEGEMIVKLPFCLHLFHERCIHLWFRHNSTCPLCRFDQLSIDMVWLWSIDLQEFVIICESKSNFCRWYFCEYSCR